MVGALTGAGESRRAAVGALLRVHSAQREQGARLVAQRGALGGDRWLTRAGGRVAIGASVRRELRLSQTAAHRGKHGGYEAERKAIHERETLQTSCLRRRATTTWLDRVVPSGELRSFASGGSVAHRHAWDPHPEALEETSILVLGARRLEHDLVPVFDPVLEMLNHHRSDLAAVSIADDW